MFRGLSIQNRELIPFGERERERGREFSFEVSSPARRLLVGVSTFSHFSNFSVWRRVPPETARSMGRINCIEFMNGVPTFYCAKTWAGSWGNISIIHFSRRIDYLGEIINSLKGFFGVGLKERKRGWLLS